MEKRNTGWGVEEDDLGDRRKSGKKRQRERERERRRNEKMVRGERRRRKRGNEKKRERTNKRGKVYGGGDRDIYMNVIEREGNLSVPVVFVDIVKHLILFYALPPYLIYRMSLL